MPTETVSIVIGADFKGAYAFNEAKAATQSLQPPLTAYANNAKIAAKAGALLANSLGASEFAQAASELGHTAAIAKMLGNELDGASKYAGLLKVGIGLVVVGAAYKLGTLIGDWAFNTARARHELELYTKDLAKTADFLTAATSRRITADISDVQYLEQAKQAEAYAAVLGDINSKIEAQTAKVAEAEAAVNSYNTMAKRSFFAEGLKLETDNFESQKKQMAELLRLRTEIYEKTSQRAKDTESLKTDAKNREAVQATLDGLTKERDAMLLTKRQIIELDLARHNASKAQREDAIIQLQQIDNLEREKKAREELINIQKEAAAVVERNNEENERATERLNDHLQGLRDQVELLNVAKKEQAAFAAGRDVERLGGDADQIAEAKNLQREIDRLTSKTLDREFERSPRLDATEGRFLTLRRDTDPSQEAARNTAKLLEVLPGLKKLIDAANVIANNTKAQIGLVA